MKASKFPLTVTTVSFARLSLFYKQQSHSPPPHPLTYSQHWITKQKPKCKIETFLAKIPTKLGGKFKHLFVTPDVSVETKIEVWTMIDRRLS